MTNQQQKILVVDDETKIVEIVSAYLKNNNYEVIAANDGVRAISLFDFHQPDLVVLDLMLPGVMGEDVCRHIRKQSNVPILMLTAKASEEEKIKGFHLGADDYLTKPFSPRELVVRIESLLRRSGGIAPLMRLANFNQGDLEIDFPSFAVKKNGNEVGLTQTEFRILSIFVKYPKRVFTREELISLALGDDYEGTDRVIDSHIKNLRSKIESDAFKYIATIHGVGYKFVGGFDEIKS